MIKIASNFFCILVLCSFSSLPVLGQVYNGSISLFSQKDVDEFPSNYPNIHKISGFLRIRSIGANAITNLDSLHQLTCINGTLDMRTNDSLRSVYGLRNLDTIGMSLYLSMNPVLPDLNGFNQLKYIGRNLEMSYCDSLKSIAGLNALQHVAQDVLIGRLNNLKDFDGLRNLQYVGQNFNLTFLRQAQSIDSLSGLTHIGAGLLLGLLDSVKQVDPLLSLDSIGGYLTLLLNGELTNINGLANMKQVQSLRIDSNSKLTDCCGVFDLVNTPGAVVGSLIITNNATGCETTADVIACDADGDGFQASKDCDDSDPAIYPGAMELCDGIDNNCDGMIDENLLCYCISSGTSTQQEWIDKVKFGNLNNFSGNNDGYGDFTDQVAQLVIDEYHFVKLEPGFSQNLKWEYWRIWIDFNQDGDFSDEDEMVYQNVFFFDLYAFIQIPATAETGQTRMRVAMSPNGFADPCETNQEGEVEDYTVYISVCDNVESGGIIGDDELLCAGNTTAAPIINISAASGGTGSLEYIWMKNTTTNDPPNYNNTNGWSVITDATEENYDPGELTETTWFIRCARRTGCNSFVGESNVVEKRVQESCDPYCISSGMSTNFEWIKKVTFGDINNNSGNDNGYGDYTGMSTEVIPGLEYRIKLKPGFTYGAYDEYWRVWIDWNQDGDFEDDNEVVVQSVQHDSFRKDFEVPEDALPGETRMRVAMKYGSFPNACQNFNEGEVEDYTILVLPGTVGMVVRDQGAENAVSEREDDENHITINMESITLYPNPSTNLLNVRIANFLEGTLNISIQNAIGQELLRQELDSSVNGKTQFDVTEYGEGMYFLTIEKEGQEPVSKSFMVVH